MSDKKIRVSTEDANHESKHESKQESKHQMQLLQLPTSLISYCMSFNSLQDHIRMIQLCSSFERIGLIPASSPFSILLNDSKIIDKCAADEQDRKKPPRNLVNYYPTHIELHKSCSSPYYLPCLVANQQLKAITLSHHEDDDFSQSMLYCILSSIMLQTRLEHIIIHVADGVLNTRSSKELKTFSMIVNSCDLISTFSNLLSFVIIVSSNSYSSSSSSSFSSSSLLDYLPSTLQRLAIATDKDHHSQCILTETISIQLSRFSNMIRLSLPLVLDGESLYTLSTTFPQLQELNIVELRNFRDSKTPSSAWFPSLTIFKTLRCGNQEGGRYYQPISEQTRQEINYDDEIKNVPELDLNIPTHRQGSNEFLTSLVVAMPKLHNLKLDGSCVFDLSPLSELKTLHTLFIRTCNHLEHTCHEQEKGRELETTAMVIDTNWKVTRDDPSWFGQIHKRLKINWVRIQLLVASISLHIQQLTNLTISCDSFHDKIISITCIQFQPLVACTHLQSLSIHNIPTLVSQLPRPMPRLEKFLYNLGEKMCITRADSESIRALYPSLKTCNVVEDYYVEEDPPGDVD